MKKFILVAFLLSIFACSNINVLFAGENGDDNDIIPEYVIDAPWPQDSGSGANSANTVNSGAPENNSGNNSNNGSGNSGDNLGDNSGDDTGNNSGDNSGDNLSESDLQEISKLDLSEDDFGDEQSLFEKIKSKLPNIKISKKLVIKVLKIVAMAGVAGIASYAGYKFVTAAVTKINGAAVVVGDACKSAVSTACKYLAALAACILLVKYAVSK